MASLIRLTDPKCGAVYYNTARISYFSDAGPRAVPMTRVTTDEEYCLVTEDVETVARLFREAVGDTNHAELEARRRAAVAKEECRVPDLSSGEPSVCPDCKRVFDGSAGDVPAVCTGWPDPGQAKLSEAKAHSAKHDQRVQLDLGRPGPFCEDGGVCRHECRNGRCYRRILATPLSGVFPGNQWPENSGGEG